MQHFPASWCFWVPVKQYQTEFPEMFFQILYSALQTLKEYASKLWKILCTKSSYEICISAPSLESKRAIQSQV